MGPPLPSSWLYGNHYMKSINTKPTNTSQRLLSVALINLYFLDCNPSKSPRNFPALAATIKCLIESHRIESNGGNNNAFTLWTVTESSAELASELRGKKFKSLLLHFSDFPTFRLYDFLFSLSPILSSPPYWVEGGMCKWVEQHLNAKLPETFVPLVPITGWGQLVPLKDT